MDERTIVQRNIDSLRDVAEITRSVGVGVMIENVPGRFNSAVQLAPILDAIHGSALHLDIGHCNLSVTQNTAGELIERFIDRLAHVHLHDNRGGHADLHLALGMGNLDVAGYVRQLRARGYDDTITLEVFARDRHFPTSSRDRLRAWWDPAA